MGKDFLAAETGAVGGVGGVSAAERAVRVGFNGHATWCWAVVMLGLGCGCAVVGLYSCSSGRQMLATAQLLLTKRGSERPTEADDGKSSWGTVREHVK